MKSYGVKLLFAIICAFVLSTAALYYVFLCLLPDAFSSVVGPIKKRDCDGKHEWIGGCYTMYACSKCGDRWKVSETRCKYCFILKKDETVARYKHRCSGFFRDDDNTAWVDKDRGSW